VVSGGRSFRAAVAPVRGELAVFVEGEVGPLAGGQGAGRCIGQAPSLAVVLNERVHGGTGSGAGFVYTLSSCP
jgi:hypothetical protein